MPVPASSRLTAQPVDDERFKTPVGKPNLLLIIADQLRFDAFGCTGSVAPTPHIDELARGGVVFSEAVTASPQCVPARLALATGRYPHQTGIWSNTEFDLPVETPTWMRSIQSAGYHTAKIGKAHLYRQVGDLRQREARLRSYGFDYVEEVAGPTASLRTETHLSARWKREGWYDAFRADIEDRYSQCPWVARPSPLPLDLYPDSYVGRRAAEWLAEYRCSQPWLCVVGFPGPHDPWDAPEPYASRFAPSDMVPARRAPADVGKRPRGEHDRHVEIQLSGNRPTPAEIRTLRANYAGKVALIDDEVGRIVATIRARGEIERTIIIVTADHGEMNGDADLLYKSTFLDGATRIPLIVRAPGALGAGGVSRSPVELFDVSATLVDYAGAGRDATSAGLSLRRALEAPADHIRNDAISEFKHEVMLLDEDWKVALNRGGDAYLLFDRRADPLESTNLAGDPGRSRIVAKLRARIVARLRAAGAPGGGAGHRGARSN